MIGSAQGRRRFDLLKLVMWMIGSVSAAYQSAVRGDRLRLMQSITVDYIECLAVGSLRRQAPLCVDGRSVRPSAPAAAAGAAAAVDA